MKLFTMALVGLFSCMAFLLQGQVETGYSSVILPDTLSNYGSFGYIQFRRHHGANNPKSGKGILESSFVNGDYIGLDLRLGVQTNGRMAWEQQLNYPQFGFGINCFLLKDSASIVNQGYPTSLYAFLGLPFLWSKTNKFYFTMGFAAGISYRFHLYQPIEEDRIFQEIYRMQAYYNFDLSANHRLSPRFDLNYGINLIHYSNGRLKSPNPAYNFIGIDLGLKWHINLMQNYYKTYYPDYKLPVRPVFIQQILPEFQPYSKWNAWFGSGKISSTKHVINDIGESEEIRGPSYFAGSIGIEYHRYFGPNYSIGLGLSGQYDGSSKQFYSKRGLDSTFGDRATISIGPLGEFYISRFSLFAQFAVYAYQTGIYKEDRNVWHLRGGLRTRITDHFYHHLVVKTRAGGIADWIEFGFGYSFFEKK